MLLSLTSSYCLAGVEIEKLNRTRKNGKRYWANFNHGLGPGGVNIANDRNMAVSCEDSPAHCFIQFTYVP